MNLIMISLEEIGILTGIFSALAAAIYFVLEKIGKRRLKLRRKISGKWINAGEASFDNSESHNIELELEVDLEDGEIGGVVKSIRIDGQASSPLCSVVGKLRFRSSRIQILHSRYGEGILFGEAKISLKNKVLVWKLKSGTADFFPNYTVLFRQSQL